MTLYMIGLGLNDENDITLRGLEIIQKADQVWLERYTSILNCSREDLESRYGREVRLADRDLVEKGAEEIIGPAAEKDVAFLVVGDPMSATTHVDIMLRAREKGVRVEVIHNASVMTAVGTVGLDLYKYGRTTTIVFPSEGVVVESFYDVVKENKSR
ncbi:diphthine synthase, partial [Candidatus Woesearchaeota archaeon]|nr:diphthine synthase [Candidatus Woesearchaeota archaeon]